MKKVVMKVKVKGRDEFEEKISQLGYDFGPLYWQHDRVYVPRGYKRARNLPRFILRTEMNAIDRPAKYYLILKRHIEDSGIEIENVSLIKDYTEVVEMVMQLGFTLEAEVSRKRQEARISENEKIFLDKIEGVNGVFAKFERTIFEDEKVVEARNEIFGLFERIDERNIVEKSYAEILKKQP